MANQDEEIRGEDSNQMANQDEEIRGEDSKGKEIAGIRGIRRPPLSFLSIFKKYDIPLRISCRDELCQQLYAGVFLRANTLKYYVDKTSNENCFVLFARELSITHGGNTAYWQWTTEKESSGEDIEVAELRDVCWLDIRGTIETINLSPGRLYEIVFTVKMVKHSKFSVDLIIRPRHTKALKAAPLKRNESLKGKPLGDWFEIPVGEFKMIPEYVGNMEFCLEQHDGEWKRGLVVKCAIIRPKKEVTR